MAEFALIRPFCRPAAAPRPPEQVRRLLALLVGLSLTLIIGGLVAVIIHLRAAALDEASTSLQGVARLLDEHLSRTLATTDAILVRAAAIAQSRMKGKITAEAENREFQQLANSLPERGAMISTDSRGIVITNTTVPAGTGGDVSAAEWFKSLADGAPTAVGPMFRNRFNNRLIFTVSRRVENDDGGFAGMVSVGIEVAVFTDFHKSLILGDNGFVGADANGKLMLRQPNPDAYVGSPDVGKRVVAAASVEPQGLIRNRSAVDGVDRIIAYRALPAHNVVVSAGMAIEEILAPWRKTALLLGSAILVICTGLVSVAMMAFRAISREEAIAAGLEAAVVQRTLESEQRALEARMANESKTRFLAAASHDLRQPLQAAGMFTEVLSSRLSEPAQIQVVDKLRQSIEATNSLLTSLLDVSTLEAGKVKPNVSSFRLAPLLNGLIDQMEPEASAKGLSIGAFHTSAAVTSDPVLLERVLRNLLVNAIRYTETGGVRIGCRRRGDFIAIQIWDTGVGIPEDKQKAVFEDFVRLDAVVDKKTSKGLGLGLGVVRRMASLLGHRLELCSIPGKGSRFTVVAPRA